jgi:hypothetical protein
VCVDRTRTLGDPSGLMDPFLSVAVMFQAIEPRP